MLINCNECTTLVGDVEHEGACARVGKGVYGKAVPSTHFFCEPKLL